MLPATQGPSSPPKCVGSIPGRTTTPSSAMGIQIVQEKPNVSSRNSRISLADRRMPALPLSHARLFTRSTQARHRELHGSSDVG
jgi:hypothetical protein